MKNRAKTGGGFVFFLKEGLSNLRVNGFMSFAAISIIALCILIVGSFGLTAININKEIVSIRNDSQIMVFIHEDHEDKSVEIEKEIEKITDISEIEFVSKEKALDDYKLSLGDDAIALEGLENDNPLRDGFTLHLSTLDNIDSVTDKLSSITGIDKVSSQNETFKALSSVEKGFNVVALVLLIALGSISIFIISNTVKLAMFARRSEISIMKMIGATDGFIRWPFVAEGLVLGVVGAIMAFFLQWFFYNEFAIVINQYIGFVELIEFMDIAKYTLVAFLCSGILIGVSGSTLTIRKFLDV